MGGGTYTVSNAFERSVEKGYATKSTREVFKSTSINNAMSPFGVTVRESCDSEEHPETLPIIIALDVTGSMGTVPHHLVKEGLPHIMGEILKKGVSDPQVLFFGIGDHECDTSPLQVGQFESSDELLDKWLTDVYLEGGGGGNYGESYLLAWYFAAKHTSIDSLKKRGQKGLLFTIGDEPCLKYLPEPVIKGIMGPGQYQNFEAAELLEMAREKYEVFHIHIRETGAGSMREPFDDWKQLIQDHLLPAQRHEDVPGIIAGAILEYVAKSKKKEEQTVTKEDVGSVEEIL